MINNISYLTGIIQPPNLHQRKNISFGQNIQTLTHTNIGSCLEGYIGKIRVRKPDGEAYLNVFKKYIGRDAENFSARQRFRLASRLHAHTGSCGTH